MSVIGFNDKFPGRTLIEHAAAFPSSVGDRTLPAAGVATKAKVVARVNAGRWIADCPQDGCDGAEYADFTGLLFFCCECRNAGVGHKPIKVQAPDAEMRESVEALLTVRPAPATRNWEPGEKVARLEAENAERGVA